MKLRRNKDQTNPNEMSNPVIVSVIICSHNRVKLLDAILTNLTNQDFDPIQFEIIIVDNASQDGTRDFISYYSKKTIAPRIRYEYEGHIGISSARNAGWQAAQGKYIAYIDDDERAGPDWLKLLVTALEEHSRPVVAVGGPIQLDWGGHRPEWLPVSMERFYSKVDLGNEARNLNEKEYLLTSNLAIRRELIDELGGFRTDLGHVGNNPIGGEDVEMIDRIFSTGKQVFYEPKAVIHHQIPKQRQTRRWLLRRCYYGGMSTPILDNLKKYSLRDILYHLRQAMLYSIKALWFMIIRQRLAVVENGCSSLINLGRAVGMIRL